jgi:hypothetical protein
MVDIHFINSSNPALAALNDILNAAGSSFLAPYDTSTQPPSGTALNAETLLQFQLPGGASLQGYSEPSAAKSISSSINSLMACLAPFVSAYTMLLPIMGVIRGILEVICALMNPFAVIAAVERLIAKWIPPFIALFPPFAGVLMIMNIIKVILAIVFFVVTVIIPMIELIKHNVIALEQSFGSDGNPQQQAAIKHKLTVILADILNQIGLFSVIQPILDLVMNILKLAGGIPCGSGDSTCCNDTVCPPVLKNPPTGTGLLYASPYSDAPVGFAWKLLPTTGYLLLPELAPFVQNLSSQLNAQLDKPVNIAVPAGQTGDSANFDVQISGMRGGSNTVTVPLADLNGITMTLINGGLAPLGGMVNYTIVPNWPMLIAQNLVSMGCLPTISTAIANMSSVYDGVQNPALVNHPELNIPHAAMIGELDGYLNDLSGCVDCVVNHLPPYDDCIDCMNNAENNIVGLMNNYAALLKGVMNTTLGDIALGTLSVDKTIVKADDVDVAVISVTPVDIAGNAIAQNLPSGVGIAVEIHTTFGVLSDQQTNNATGVTTATLRSPFPGVADITALVSSKPTEPALIQVTFVSDAVLPARRKLSKQNPETASAPTTGGPDRQPGGTRG